MAIKDTMNLGGFLADIKRIPIPTLAIAYTFVYMCLHPLQYQVTCIQNPAF